MSVETNLNSVIEKRLSILGDLGNADKIFREAALNTVVLISDRVQQKGKKSNGQSITTKAKEKTGAYSKSYGKRRIKEGRQVKHIDQTFTGDMMDNLVPEPEGKTNYVVGFRGEKPAQKAEWNEDRFGAIFELSNTELKSVLGIINNRIDAILG